MSKIVDVLMSRTAFIVVAVFAVAFFIYDIRTSAQIFGTNIRCWNLPNISITFALLLALYLARQIDRRMRAALHELWLQGTISEAADPLQQRILEGRPQLKYHEAGLDMGWTTDPYESFRIFQGKIRDEYETMVNQFPFSVVDATREIHEQQSEVRKFISDQIDLRQFRRSPS